MSLLTQFYPQGSGLLASKLSTDLGLLTAPINGALAWNAEGSPYEGAPGANNIDNLGQLQVCVGTGAGIYFLPLAPSLGNQSTITRGRDDRIGTHGMIPLFSGQQAHGGTTGGSLIYIPGENLAMFGGSAFSIDSPNAQPVFECTSVFDFQCVDNPFKMGNESASAQAGSAENRHTHMTFSNLTDSYGLFGIGNTKPRNNVGVTKVYAPNWRTIHGKFKFNMVRYNSGMIYEFQIPSLDLASANKFFEGISLMTQASTSGTVKFDVTISHSRGSLSAAAQGQIAGLEALGFTVTGI